MKTRSLHAELQELGKRRLARLQASVVRVGGAHDVISVAQPLRATAEVIDVL